MGLVPDGHRVADPTGAVAGAGVADGIARLRREHAPAGASGSRCSTRAGGGSRAARRWRDVVAVSGRWFRAGHDARDRDGGRLRARRLGDQLDLQLGALVELGTDRFGSGAPVSVVAGWTTRTTGLRRFILTSCRMSNALS